jgi:hypothetical protein
LSRVFVATSTPLQVAFFEVREMVKELSKREVQRIKKMFEEKKLRSQKKKQRTEPKGKRNVKNKRQKDWRSFSDEEGYNG